MNRRKFLYGAVNNKSSFKPHPGSPGPKVFTNALLRTHEDKPVRFYDDLIMGRQVMINLMYASCEGECPAVTSKLVKVHEILKHRMGKDLFMYSITIKPEDDNAAALKRFAEMHGALLPGWTFLTGSAYDIETIRYNLFRMDHIAIDGNLNAHTSMLRIINDSTNRWVEVNPMTGVDRILRHVSWTDPIKSFKERMEENKRVQQKINEEVKKYGYRRSVG